MSMIFRSSLLFALGFFAIVYTSSTPGLCESTAPTATAPKADVPTAEAPKADALVVSCVDYRFVDHFAKALDEKGLGGKYSLLTMAGASLAPTNDFFPAWKDTFWSHLAFLVNLHRIDSVILIDHRDCGMYTFVYGRNLSLDPADEKHVHQENMQDLKSQINKRHPQLKVELWLIDTSGKIEVLG